MYKLPYFTETDQQAVIEFMKEHSFAIVTAMDEQYPVATHVPLHIDIKDDGKILLTGHIMRKSDHHKAFEKNDHVLVIFNGPHTYVSASWYANPKSASTWNYMTVHAKGKIQLHDETETYKAVKDITEKYEGTKTEATFDKLGDNYVHAMIKAIVAFTIEVQSFDNVFKLSQNHTGENQQSIIEQLRKRGDENSVKIANEMEKRLKQSIKG